MLRVRFPQGVSSPALVTDGYFTGPGAAGTAVADVTHQQYQTQCPPGSYCTGGVRYDCPGGTYGASPGLLDRGCSGACNAGYYCPPGSSSARAAPCGNVTVYCPAGSASPRVAAAGEYTTGLDVATMNGSASCQSGSYCVNGTSRLCPGGTFGCADRLVDATCNGLCSAGYYCPPGATSNAQHACGGNASSEDAAAVYCPPGAAAPTPVDVGYYSTGSGADSPHVRSGEAQCPPGTYCDAGVMVRLTCTEGGGSCCGRLYCLTETAHSALCFGETVPVLSLNVHSCNDGE